MGIIAQKGTILSEKERPAITAAKQEKPEREKEANQRLINRAVVEATITLHIRNLKALLTVIQVLNLHTISP